MNKLHNQVTEMLKSDKSKNEIFEVIKNSFNENKLAHVSGSWCKNE